MPDRRLTRGFAPAAQAVAVAALGVVIVWMMYLARDVLLLIYVSVLLAIGFGPVVHAIEHQQVVPVGKRLPRWLAILITSGTTSVAGDPFVTMELGGKTTSYRSA